MPRKHTERTDGRRLLKEIANFRPTFSLIPQSERDLIEAACEAQELFELDDLERHAQHLAAKWGGRVRA